MKRFSVLLLGAIFLSLTLACASKAVSTSPTSTTSAPTSTTSTPTSKTSAPATTSTPVRPTGNLRIGVAELSTEEVDPFYAALASLSYARLIYDHIVGVDPKTGDLSKDTGLASDWKVSADGMSYTFTLRKGITFQNGDLVTAEDAKFSIERAIRPENTQSNTAGLLRPILKDIQVVDPYTLVVNTKTPSIFVPYYLSLAGPGLEGAVVPKKVVESMGDAAFSKKPIGSGPYRFSEQVRGTRLVLEAMPNHWLIGVPKYQTLTFQIIPEESTRIAALKTGAVDIIAISADNLQQVSGTFNFFSNTAATTVGASFNNQWEKIAPYNDKRVREAMNIAINREEISKFFYKGMAEPAASGPQANNVLTLGAPKGLKVYPFDQARAKRLLADAGFGSGFTVDFYSYAKGTSPEMPQLAQALVGYWEAIGIKVNIKATDWGTIRPLWSAGKLSNSLQTNPVATRAVGNAGWNGYFFSTGNVHVTQDPALDAIISQTLAAPDLATWTSLQGKIIQYSYDNFLEVPVANTGPIFATVKSVTDWQFPLVAWDLGYQYLVMRR